MTERFQGYVLAGFWRRAWGHLIDAALVGTLSSAGRVAVSSGHPTAVLVKLALIWALSSTYYIWGFGSGQTIGCQAAGLRIVNADTGGRPGYVRGTVRYLVPSLLLVFVVLVFALLAAIARIPGQILFPLMVLTALLVWLGDYLVMLVNPGRQTLHDAIAGTYVIDARKQRATAPQPADAGPAGERRAA